MTSKEVAAQAFENLPKLKSVWVDSKGEYHLYAKEGCERFDKEPIAAVEEVKEIKSFSKKKK
jgi:hypothetical protein